MKASQDFIAIEDSGRSDVPAGDSGAGRVAGFDGGDGPGSAGRLESALALLRDLSSTAAGDSALWGFRVAADFAGQVEELSRFVEHLQVIGAGAVDRTRKQAAASAGKASTSWTTGWRDDAGTATTPPTADAASGGEAGGRVDSSYGTPAAGKARGVVAAGVAGAVAAEAAAAVVDDGYRNTTEFLRARLRISSAEARRRLALSESLLPRQGFTGESLPAVRGELGAAVSSGEVASRAATTISLALDRVRHTCPPEAADRMEHALTRVAAENDADFLARVARKWIDALDQDGAEPSEELLRQLQGAFIRRPRHGLHHLEIFATADQFEQLVTVIHTGTNPRTSTTADTVSASVPASGSTPGHGVPGEEGVPGERDDGGSAGAGVPLDLRTRPQRQLDGLVGACKIALAAGGLPAAGGLRPQVMVTIDYRDLLVRLENLGNTDRNTDGDAEGGDADPC